MRHFLHNMTENVGRCGKLLEEQDSLVETWAVIGEVGWCSYLENAYKRRIEYQF